MNPIHESGFASLVVLALGTTPAALAALIALVAARCRPRVGAAFAVVAGALSALVLAVAALMTRRLHAVIDFWIGTGGYGPPADVTRTYGPEWHDSARFTAIVGIVLTVVPIALAGLAYRLSRRDKVWGPAALTVTALLGLALAACGLMAVA